MNHLITQWNLDKLLGSDNDPGLPGLQRAVTAANQVFIDVWSGRDDYLRDPEILRQALDHYESLARSFGTSGSFGFYFSLRQAQDQSDPTVKAQTAKIREFSTELENKIQFFELNLAKIPRSKQAGFLQAECLHPYRHWLEQLFAHAKHTLSEPEERIMNFKAPTAGAWKRLTPELLGAEERDLPQPDGSRKSCSFAEISKLTSNRDKTVRDSAAEALNEILAKHLKVAEAELNALLQSKKTNDQIRGYERPESARLLSDDIDGESVRAMLDAVSSRFDLPKRYYGLKARLLGLPRLAYHERSVEYGSIDRTYGYPEALDLVRQTFNKLDPEFSQVLDKLSTGGQIDVYPKPGKRDGAFCAMNLVSQPTYVLLNHTDRLTDVLTIAHELGHAINDELIKNERHALDAHTPLSTAEVASTFMEDFVVEALSERADSELLLSLAMLRLDRDVSTIFRQVACFLFELDLHARYREQGFLSSQAIGDLFLHHMGAYMGDAVSMDPGSENWWVYWSHIRNYFYVYSYASGELISKSLQAMVRKDPADIAKVKVFLAAGSSASPKNIFGAMGIDITDPEFWLRGLADVERRLAETEEVATRLGI